MVLRSRCAVLDTTPLKANCRTLGGALRIGIAKLLWEQLSYPAGYQFQPYEARDTARWWGGRLLMPVGGG